MCISGGHSKIHRHLTDFFVYAGSYSWGDLATFDAGTDICNFSVTIAAEILVTSKAANGSSLSPHAGRTASYTVLIRDRFDVRIALFDETQMKSHFSPPTTGVQRVLKLQKVVSGQWQFSDGADGFTASNCTVCKDANQNCAPMALNNSVSAAFSDAIGRIEISCTVSKNGQSRNVHVLDLNRAYRPLIHSPSDAQIGSPSVSQ